MSHYIPIPKRDCKLEEKFDSYNAADEDTRESEIYEGVIESTPEDNPNFEGDWMSVDAYKKSEYSKPRMFTIKQIRDLIYLHLSRSEINRKVFRHQSTVEYHDQTIFEQGRQHKKLQGDMKEEFDNVYKGVEDLGGYLEGLRKIYDKKFSDIFRMMTISDKKLNVLKQNDDEFKIFNDVLNGKTERLDNRLMGIKKIIEDNMEKDKAEVGVNIKKLREFVNDEVEKMESSMNHLKSTCIELIEINKETLQSEIQNDFRDAKEQVESTKEKFDEKMKEALEIGNNRIIKIKDIWANYFEKYDKVNQSVEDKFKKINETFNYMRETFVKPHQMSEARLYTVETRLKETEDKFFNSVSHTKEIMKKLVFALEQENISKRDSLVSQIIKNFNQIENEKHKNTIKSVTQNSEPKEMASQNLDLLFIKRLLYIKHEIDEYPFEKQATHSIKDRIEGIESGRSHTPKSLLAGRKSVHYPYKVDK